MIKVLLVERHSVPRFGLRGVLGRDPSIEVATALTIAEALRMRSDVTVVSYCSVCDLPSPELIGMLCGEHRVIIHSGKESPVSLLSYQHLTAHSLLHQSDSDKRLTDSVHAAAADAPRLKSKAAPASGLSQRERQVLMLVADGYTNYQIARRIGISEHTVDTYIRRIRQKLRLGNKAQLARAAMQLNRMAER
jgi:DNA-binding NarL/FixJ family response regulator